MLKMLHILYCKTKGSELLPETLTPGPVVIGCEILSQQPRGRSHRRYTHKKMHDSHTQRVFNQQNYVKEILVNDINLGIGPAGTGNTSLVIACAYDALCQQQVRHVLLVRLSAEAVGKLGFLLRDLAQKETTDLRQL